MAVQQTTTKNNNTYVQAQGAVSSSRSGPFESIKNYTKDELRNVLDESEPIRYYISTNVAVNPSIIDHGELDNSKLEAEYALLFLSRTIVEYNVTDYFLEHANSMDIRSALDVGDDASIATTDSENNIQTLLSFTAIL